MPDRADLDAILDRPDPADAAPAADATPEPEAPEAPASEAEAPADATPDDPWESGADTFERPYVEGLRRENQRYRQRAKRYDEVFSDYSEEDREFLLGLAADIRQNPAQAAQRAAQLAQALQASTPPDEAPVTPQEAQYLTANDVQRMLAERDQRNAQEAEVANVFKSAESMGYKQDTPELIELLYVAANETDNDLKAADAAIKARRQKIIDDYLAQKAKESDQTPDTRTPGGSAPSGEQKIGSIADATRALRGSNLGR